MLAVQRHRVLFGALDGGEFEREVEAAYYLSAVVSVVQPLDFELVHGAIISLA